MNPIDEKLFDQHVSNDGKLVLVIPARSGAVGNAPWTPETIKYRSRVEDSKGQTVSQGFKKFFNLGTGPNGLRVEADQIVRAIAIKDAIATLKIDGSLLIRSVFEGKVMLRTRGSFGYEFLDNADEMELFKTKYPRLFDPGYMASYSLLLEWTSPRNVIVIKYDEPALTLVGGVNHFPYLPYCSMAQLKYIGSLLGVPVVPYFTLDAEGWAKLNAELESNDDIEGYVIRLYREQVLVKVKCLPYLTKHALKSTLSSEKLADMWFQQDQPDFKTFCESFLAAFDEETFMWALGAISNLFEGAKEFQKIISHMGKLAGDRKEWTRKEAAIQGQKDYGTTKRFSLYMNIWEGQMPKTELLKSLLLQCTKQTEIGMFKPTTTIGD